MESIHPNDIMTLDMDSISYVTLKNGNMILIDDSVPQKSDSKKGNNPISSSINQNESKVLPKEIKLKISSPLIISFEGNMEPNKYKSNFKICSEIINNTNFSFNAVKNNKNNFNKSEIENIDTNNYNDKEDKMFVKTNKRIKKINNDDNNKDIDNSYLNNQSLKENEIKPKINIQNDDNENDINNSKTEKSEFNQSNLNTNLSIPIGNIQNNPINTSNTNNNEGNRRSRSSLFGGKGRKSRISINAVCSLNIKAEEKYNINLIHQFNGIVDKLNQERGKKPIYDLIENENNNNNRNIKYYEYYKNNNQNKFMRNIETLNQNYGISTNNNFNYHKINETNNYNTFNNYDKRKSLDLTGFNKSNDFKNTLFRESFGKSPARVSFNKIKNFRDKIYKYSSELVLPSNKMSNKILHI